MSAAFAVPSAGSVAFAVLSAGSWGRTEGDMLLMPPRTLDCLRQWIGTIRTSRILFCAFLESPHRRRPETRLPYNTGFGLILCPSVAGSRPFGAASIRSVRRPLIQCGVRLSGRHRGQPTMFTPTAQVFDSHANVATTCIRFNLVCGCFRRSQTQDCPLDLIAETTHCASNPS